MKKKLLAALLCVAMMGTMLAGCGSKDGETKTEDTKTEAGADDKSKEAGDEAADAVGSDFADKKVGICIYKFDDNFMTLYREELVNYLIELGFDKDNITVMDGKNDQAEQTNQINNFIAQGVDVLVVNPVNASSAATITDTVTAAGIPLVYINREPEVAEEERWTEEDLNVTYVGADAKQSGTFQGEILTELGKEVVDVNGDGTIGYTMIQGDPENVDAQNRTEFSVKALVDAGWKVEQLDIQRADWDQAIAQQKVQDELSQYGDKIEVVFCNNDAMALGALQSIQAANRTINKDIFLLGVDALTEALENVQSGSMTGTVFNDHIGQSHTAGDAAVAFLKGQKVDKVQVIDYIKVTKDNAADILAILKK